MPDRAPRLGDVIDDYCPRCRLLLNHDVTSLFDAEVAKVTCRTCHNTHDYRHAQTVSSVGSHFRYGADNHIRRDARYSGSGPAQWRGPRCPAAGPCR